MIWLLVGEDYSLVGMHESTPCKMHDGSLVYLDKVKEGQPFKIWFDDHWEDVCVTSSIFVKGKIRLSLQKGEQSPSSYEREVLQEAILDRLNDKEFLEKNGLFSVSVELNEG